MARNSPFDSARYNSLLERRDDSERASGTSSKLPQDDWTFTHKDDSYAARQKQADGVSRTGSIASRGKKQVGRGYYHPDRVEMRWVKRSEREARKRYGF